MWHWRGPSALEDVREAAAAARRFLTEQGLRDEEISGWELVITEAANNPVVHAPQAQPWRLELRVTPAEVTAVLTDHSAGFDWPENVELPDPESESGRGLFLIVSLTDFQHYHRDPAGNVLTLRRNRVPALPEAAASPTAAAKAEDEVAALESVLDSMTEELSSAYESLSAIFRFSAESGRLTDLTSFTQSLLEHLTTVTRSDCGVVKLSAADGEPARTLAVLGCDPDCAAGCADGFLPLEEESLRSRQDQWIDASGDKVLPGVLSGLVHPFFDGDNPMGTLTLGRRTLAEPLRAGEVNVIHTFSEFLAQHILRRRHEEAALRASIVKRELELAAAIQRSLLPRSMPVIAGLSLSAHCESAMDVGGDFYGVLPWGETGVFFMMADVMGKGVGASMMAAVTRSALRSVPHLYQDPGLVLRQTARFLYEDLDHLGMFVTAVVGTVDVPSGKVRIASAGHCPVLITGPDGGVQEIPACGPPLGLLEEMEYPATEVDFPPGSHMLVFTDGLTDPRDSRGAFESHEDLAAWLENPARESAVAGDLHAALLERLRLNGSTAALADDQTFLIIRRQAPPASNS